jgi:hypothetical protein
LRFENDNDSQHRNPERRLMSPSCCRTPAARRARLLVFVIALAALAALPLFARGEDHADGAVAQVIRPMPLEFGSAPMAGAPAATPFAPEHGKIATGDATPVGAGVVELELAYAPTWNRSGAHGFDRSADGHAHPVDLTLSYGIGDHVDVHLGAGWAEVHDAALAPTRGNGLGDASLATRWRFVADAERALDVAWIAAVVAPTGFDGSADELGVSKGYWSLENALALSKDLGPRLTANAELGWSASLGSARGNERGVLFANGAVGYHLTRWLQPELELNYEQTSLAAVADPRLLAVTAGLVLRRG